MNDVKTFFTSDTHFFHQNVIKFCNRPFDSVEHMNYTMIHNWNSRVRPWDHIWFLGDLSFGKVEETEQILYQLNGIKHLITGNHDRKGRCEKLKWENHFTDQHDYYRLKVGSTKVVLCHFPFSSWERGYFQFHGHLHTLPNENQGKYCQLDVGVDNNQYMPIELQEACAKSIRGKENPKSKY